MESATTPITRTEPAPAGDGKLPFGLLLARLGQESVARFRRALKPLGLNTQQYFVLRQLQAIGAASQASLADALGIDYSNLATVTGGLAERGLIERYRHESDRRRYVVCPGLEALVQRLVQVVLDPQVDEEARQGQHQDHRPREGRGQARPDREPRDHGEPGCLRKR